MQKRLNDKIERIEEVSINLVQAAIKAEERVDDLDKKLERMEDRSAKGCFRLYGITEHKDEKPKDVIANFFKEKLKITGEVEIQTAYRVGKGKARPMFVKLYDSNETAAILKSTTNLKDVKNDNDKPFFVREQLTEKREEEPKQQRDVFEQNRGMPLSHQLPISKKKGELYVGADRYRKQVPPPSVREVMLATAERGKFLEGSSFILAQPRHNKAANTLLMQFKQTIWRK